MSRLRTGSFPPGSRSNESRFPGSNRVVVRTENATHDHKDWQVGVCMRWTIPVCRGPQSSVRFDRFVNHCSQNIYPSSYFAVIYRPESQ